MTELLGRIRKCNQTPPIFREIIDVEDYNTEQPNAKRIKKIAHSLELSEQNRELGKYKGMTIDELRMCKAISNTDDKPSPSLTDEKWQKEFNIRKMFLKNQPINQDAYIKDVLKNLQDGQVDYCYFIYQVMELAMFYPMALKTRYRDGYWEVWLKR